MQGEFGVVDLFAGPGGLAEGFSAVRGMRSEKVFSIALSIEKEASAYQTLLLRTFLRQFKTYPSEYYRFINGEIDEPDWEELYPSQMAKAKAEAMMLELGTPETTKLIGPKLDEIRRRFSGRVILIGGPPCQAYSLVGRARNKGISGYNARDDGRHFLYRAYIDVLDRLRPVAFVMENVKGILSSTVDGERIFDQILNDLSSVGDGYRLVPLALPEDRAADMFGERIRPQDFVIRAEDFGVPQARHRVIILGIRSDIANGLAKRVISGRLLERIAQKTRVRDVLSSLKPPLRSGISRGKDTPQAWHEAVAEYGLKIGKARLNLPKDSLEKFRTHIQKVTKHVNSGAVLGRRSNVPASLPKSCPKDLNEWLLDGNIKQLSCHTTRGHMKSDLGRYFFSAVYAEVVGASPKASDFPELLAPDHANWRSGKFVDRFKVQTWDSPASTITSHISKDGHYFIHPDARQCRSLTPREAARLQTFPDNYFFKGNRTQQYVQVGNAVPPFLAMKIGKVVYELIRKRK